MSTALHFTLHEQTSAKVICGQLRNAAASSWVTTQESIDFSQRDRRLILVAAEGEAHLPFCLRLPVLIQRPALHWALEPIKLSTDGTGEARKEASYLQSVFADPEARRGRRGSSASRTTAPMAFEPMPAIFPRHVSASHARDRDGEREMCQMSWGFMRLAERDKAPRAVTNVRDDTDLGAAGSGGQSFEKRRCLVPASSFCEPNGDVKPATWHWFAMQGDGRAAAVRVPRHLAAISGAGEEGRTQRRYRSLLVPHDHAEFAGRDHQSRAHAGLAHARRGIRDLAARNTPMRRSRSRASIPPERMAHRAGRVLTRKTCWAGRQ